jgi:elongation factor P
MTMSATQIRRGMVLVHNGVPCRVVEAQHIKPGKGPAYMQSKLRNLRTGAIFDHRFRAADQVDRALLETHELQFLYSDEHHYHLMNNESYEMVALDEEALGEAAQWLMPNLVIQAQFYEGRPIGIELPSTMELKVAETEPGVRGDTKSAMTKPAKLENGATVQVPPFVDEGDTIRVDPREGKYLERVR